MKVLWDGFTQIQSLKMYCMVYIYLIITHKITVKIGIETFCLKVASDTFLVLQKKS